MTIFQFEAGARAMKGVALLDQIMPDWYKKIDCNKLDMKSGRNCILGQLYGDVCKGIQALGYGFGISSLSGYGFNTKNEGDSFEKLKEEWIKIINERI